MSEYLRTCLLYRRAVLEVGVKQSQANAVMQMIGNPLPLQSVYFFTLLAQLPNEIKVVLMCNLLLRFYYYIYYK